LHGQKPLTADLNIFACFLRKASTWESTKYIKTINLKTTSNFDDILYPRYLHSWRDSEQQGRAGYRLNYAVPKENAVPKTISYSSCRPASPPSKDNIIITIRTHCFLNDLTLQGTKNEWPALLVWFSLASIRHNMRDITAATRTITT
jgi:hypothetical protein